MISIRKLKYQKGVWYPDESAGVATCLLNAGNFPHTSATLRNLSQDDIFLL
ncbi:MAG: hypothetical protein H7320_06820 [Ferruginibacter sp.]|nr:hypothetical protein [Ferruginibacter sp.]